MLHHRHQRIDTDFATTFIDVSRRCFANPAPIREASGDATACPSAKAHAPAASTRTRPAAELWSLNRHSGQAARGGNTSSSACGSASIAALS